MPRILKSFWASYYMMIKYAGPRSTNGQLWVGDVLSLALGSPVFITQQWVKGEHSIEISTFPLDVPTEVWTPQWKPMVMAIFSSPSFFLSQARNKLLAQLSKMGLERCWNQADFCPLLIQKKKKHINWATEGKSVHNGILQSDYCVQDALKSSPGLSPFISPQGCEGRTKQEDGETEAQWGQMSRSQWSVG